MLGKMKIKNLDSRSKNIFSSIFIRMQSPGDVGHIEEGTDGEVVATRGENIRENWSHMFVVFCHLVVRSIVIVKMSKQSG